MAFGSDYLYNPYAYPAGMPNYAAMQRQQVFQPQQAQQMPQGQPQQGPVGGSNIIWVQGIEAAKAYLVAPNTTVELWDQDAPTIYLKSADQSGFATMRILDWTERSNQVPTPKKEEDYILRSEFEEFKKIVLKMNEGENNG